MSRSALSNSRSAAHLLAIVAVALCVMGAAEQSEQARRAGLAEAMRGVQARADALASDLGSSNPQVRSRALAEWNLLLREFEETTDVQFAIRIISKKLPKDGGIVECEPSLDIDGKECKLEGAVVQDGKLHCIYDCVD